MNTTSATFVENMDSFSETRHFFGMLLENRDLKTIDADFNSNKQIQQSCTQDAVPAFEIELAAPICNDGKSMYLRVIKK